MKKYYSPIVALFLAYACTGGNPNDNTPASDSVLIVPETPDAPSQEELSFSDEDLKLIEQEVRGFFNGAPVTHD